MALLKKNNLSFPGTYVIFFSSLIITILILYCWEYLIFKYYKPDTTEIFALIPMFIPASENFAPEPVERLQYLSGLILAPILLFSNYYFLLNRFKSKLNKINNETQLFLITCFSFVLIAFSFLGFFRSEFNGVFFRYFISPSYIYSHSSFYILIFTFECLLIYSSIKIALVNRIMGYLIFPIVLIFLVFNFYATVFNISDLSKGLDYGHLNAVLFPISQVNIGKTLLVDLSNQYGLYPHFLEPIFRIIGLNIFNFSIIMSLLKFLSLLFIFLLMKKTVKNNIIVFLGFTTVIFFTSGFVSPEPYFQYWPIRTIFPYFSLILFYYYIEKKTKVLYCIIFSCLSLGLLWNFDSGSVAFITWIILLAYLELSTISFQKAIKNLLMHLLWAFLFISAAVTLFTLFAYFRSGSWPEYLQFFRYQKFFYLTGFFMIKMVPFHLWNLIIFVYFIGLLYASKALIDKNNLKKGAIILSISVLGLGLFSYYQGRSHDLVLAPVTAPAIILISIFLYELLVSSNNNQDKVIVNWAFSFLAIFFIGSSVTSMLVAASTFIPKVSRGMNAITSKDSNDLKNSSFIDNLSDENEQIYIIATNRESFYYAESTTKSALDLPSSTELFYKSDIDQIVNFLRDNQKIKVFVDRDNPSLFDPINNVIEAQYKIINESNSSMVLYAKK